MRAKPRPVAEDGLADHWAGQCQQAVNALAANQGTRFVECEFAGWDHHDNIYDTSRPRNVIRASAALDHALAYLLDALAALPAVSEGKANLLDETLIVAVGEFGRTVGATNVQDGRDHFSAVSPAFIAGGGVRGGEVLGATNARGSFTVDIGWSRDRTMAFGDLLATLFSAMGVDWTQKLAYSDGGPPFAVVDTSFDGPAHHIETLFRG
jgi:uncharacterized protein (DUF1501 family)